MVACCESLMRSQHEVHTVKTRKCGTFENPRDHVHRAAATFYTEERNLIGYPAISRLNTYVGYISASSLRYKIFQHCERAREGAR